MHIKGIHINGFKTYGTLTEIKNLDPQFNAITGPNGTGKSNILDAICFVLGMQNARQMRGESFADLIFQKGATGVTKAVVTLVFDNSDVNKSPPLLKDKKEIIIARQIVPTSTGIKSTYLLNGKMITQKNITDIFDSVHLNVNNPHFLVMQGQIIRVLNNSPLQNAALIEEAIGTSVYQMKKISGEKELTKKDVMKGRMDTLLKDTVEPFIGKIHSERVRCAELNKLKNEHNAIERVYVAFMYTQSQCIQTEQMLALEVVNDRLSRSRDEMLKISEQISSLENEILEKNELLDSRTEKALQLIKNKIWQAEGDASDYLREVNGLKEKCVAEEENIKLIEQNIQDHSEIYKQEADTLQNAEKAYDDLKIKKEKCLQDYNAAESKYELARIGQFIDPSSGGDGQTLQQQKSDMLAKLMELKQSKDTCAFQLKQCKIKLEENLEKFERLKASVADDDEKMNEIKRQIEVIKAKIAQLGYNQEELNDLKREIKNLEAEKEQLEIKMYNSPCRQLNFSYEVPQSDFKKELVRGAVANLFESVDKKYNRALEVTAGSKMYNVVVDNADVSFDLVKYKAFDGRTTFIPMREIQRTVIPESTVIKAKNIAGNDNVHLALSLIKFDKIYQPAMEYVFGNTLICSNNNVASTVAFHEDIRKRCISLDGDVSDPAGEQFGGFSNDSPLLMNEIVIYNELKQKLANVDTLLGEKKDRLSSVMSMEKNYRELANQLVLEEYKLASFNDLFSRKRYLELEQEISVLRQTLADIPKDLDKFTESEKQYTEKLNDVNDKIEKSLLNRPQLVEQAAKEVKNLSVELKEIEEQFRKVENSDFIRARMDDITEEIKEKKGKIECCKQSVKSFKEKIDEMMKTYQNKMDVVEKLKLDEKIKIKDIADQNDDVCQLTSSKNELQSQMRMMEFNNQQLEEQIVTIEQKIKKSKNQMEDFEKKYTWIADERDNFKVIGGDFDFTNYDERYASNRLKEISAKINLLYRDAGINLDVLNDQEAKYETLKTKTTTIVKDKEQLQAAISICDEQKNVALNDAWQKINKDFGDIFRKVLPGADAKLETVPGKNVSEGLKIKVSLGGDWKEDLSQLSGGQKSLAALSLILAMSLYKPAPIYILDEVDAALDLSHTQNIGEMIKTHFKNSQFITVSLKEGMFNNANAIFRTQLRNGVSQVNRIK